MTSPTVFTVEQYDSGKLYGWAYNPLTPDDPVDVLVCIGERVIAKGIADIYRIDLEEAGFGNGCHAFKIDIQSELIGYGEFDITLLDASGNTAEGTSYKIERPMLELSLEYIRQDPFHLHFDITSKTISGHYRIQIWVDENKCYFQDIEITNGKHQLAVAAPSVIIDGQEHLLRINIEGISESLWTGHARFMPIITPLEHVKNSHKFSQILSSSPQAIYRYASLNFQFKNNSAAIGNIGLAHSVLVEGWHNRNKFPQLSLPKVEKPLVSIIIPAYNKFELTYHCIASIILAYDETPYEVILADDCSSDETSEAETIIENLQVVRTKENLMFLHNCNNAAKHAKGQYLLFLNNDTEVTSNWVTELVNVAKNDDVGLVGSKLLNEDGSLQEAGGIIWKNAAPWNVGNCDNASRPEYNYVRNVDYLSGAALCIRKDVWLEVDGFSDYLAPAYFEDTDIAFKVREQGYKTLYVPHSEVFHFEGMTHGRDVNQGVKKNQVVNATKFAKKWIQTVKHNGQASMTNLGLHKDRNIDKRILVFDYTVPELNRDAGSYAAIQEIKLLQRLGFKVTFATDNLAHLGEPTIELQRMGVEVLYAPFYMSLEKLLSTRLPEMDAVYITRYYIAEKVTDRIKQIKPSIPIIFNNADLHFLREIRAANLSNDETLLAESETTRIRELDICKKVDVVLCYSETEKAVIGSHILDLNKIHITPWVLEAKPVAKPFETREGISFLGGFGHTPNIEAVEYLALEIMPLLMETRPDIVLHVYGSKMSDELKSYECKNIIMHGFVESLDDVYQNHRLFVAPLLSGAGIKGKVLEAMAYNLPCVLTNIAAEGTGLSDGISCSIANTPEVWVSSIIELYDNEQKWNQFAKAESLLVDQNYSPENGLNKFKDIFESVGIYI